MQRVAGPDGDPIDAQVWAELLDLVGADLFAQVGHDLATSEDDLRRGMLSGDALLLRASVHAVTGLAGTIGARHLAERAQIAHAALHGEGDARSAVQAVLREIDRLRATLARMHAAGGGADRGQQGAPA